jgi:hypothetical protein
MTSAKTKKALKTVVGLRAFVVLRMGSFDYTVPPAPRPGRVKK